MKVSAILRANLERLFDAVEQGRREGPVNGMELERASGVSKTTIYAALNETQATRTDKLEAMAEACGVEAWQLLCPSFRAEESLYAFTEGDLEREVQRRVRVRLDALRDRINEIPAGRPPDPHPGVTGTADSGGPQDPPKARRRR